MLMNTTFLEDSFLVKWQSRGDVSLKFFLGSISFDLQSDNSERLCYTYLIE